MKRRGVAVAAREGGRADRDCSLAQSVSLTTARAQRGREEEQVSSEFFPFEVCTYCKHRQRRPRGGRRGGRRGRQQGCRTPPPIERTSERSLCCNPCCPARRPPGRLLPPSSATASQICVSSFVRPSVLYPCLPVARATNFQWNGIITENQLHRRRRSRMHPI